MSIYIALLRGINVGGHKKVKMDHLRNLFESMEFENVKTYIQSGNVVFETAKMDEKSVAEKIEAKLETELGFEVKVLVLVIEQLEEAIAGNPYEIDSLSENEKVHLSFLAEVPTPEAIETLMSFESESDEFKIEDRCVYILCRKGYHKSLFSNAFLEKKLGVSATTRNWNTANKLAEMGRALI